MPPTLVSSDRGAIIDFRKKHHDIILKPLFGNGGAGVFRVKPDDENFNALLESFAAQYREPIVVQRYLPAVRKGDKRIILVEGEAVGAVLRVPAKGEARANLHVGGTAVKTKLTRRERDICAAIGPTLKQQGLALRRHRRDRRLSHRDQRHLAHRHSRNQSARWHDAREERLGCDREKTRLIFQNDDCVMKCALIGASSSWQRAGVLPAASERCHASACVRR